MKIRLLTVLLLATTMLHAQNIVITATLSSIDNDATISYPELKFNKQGMVHLEWDDGSNNSITALPKLNSTTYTDGAGNNIPYRAAVSVNGYYGDPANPLEHGNTGGASGWAVTYTEMDQLIAAKWDIGNHSLWHKELASIEEAKSDLTQLNNLIYNRIGYKMNYHVVPTNFSYYVAATDQIGMIASSTQGVKDGYPMVYGRQIISTIPNTDYLQWDRDFTDQWAADLPALKLNVDWLMETINETQHSYYRLGSHGYDAAAFNDFIDYVKIKSQDKLWVCSTREYMEYRYLRNNLIKNVVVDGNVVTITLNYSNIRNDIRWRDFSLVLNSSANLTNVTVTGADHFSYNPTTKLINVFKEQISFTPSAVLPVRFTYVKADCNKLQWGTASENNVSRFEIEKNGERIGVVLPNGSGDYQYNIVTKDMTAFRVKEIGNAGSVTYSNTILFSCNNDALRTTVSPNPATHYINLSGFKGETILIFNSNGQLLKQKKIVSDTDRIDLDGFTNGIYYIKTNTKEKGFALIKR